MADLSLMEWRNIPDYPGYKLSRDGRIERTDHKGRTNYVATARTKFGTLYVHLWKKGMRKSFMLHTLYAEVYGITEKEACMILYEGYTLDSDAKSRVIDWLQEKIALCEEECRRSGRTTSDELLYLQSFMKMME